MVGRSAVVVGATGHLGNAVVRELLARDWAVVAVSRRPEAAANLSGLDVEAVPWDADRPELPEVLSRGRELMVDAASPYLPSGGGAAIESALERTRRLLDAAGRAGATFAHVSSFATVDRRFLGFEGLSDRVPRWLHPYFELKERTEELVLEAGVDQPVVVVNPTMCLGPWDQKPLELSILPLAVRGRLPGYLDHVLNLIDVRDVAIGLVEAVERERRAEPILLCGHNLPMGDLFHWVCEIAEVPRPRWSVPTSLGILGSFVQDALIDRGSGGRAVLATLLVAQHRALFPSALQRELGVRPRPLSVTLRDALAWYREIGYC